jgi:hypothetical protein
MPLISAFVLQIDNFYMIEHNQPLRMPEDHPSPKNILQGGYLPLYKKNAAVKTISDVEFKENMKVTLAPMLLKGDSLLVLQSC